MSFGKDKMRLVASKLGGADLVCDYRGPEWIVITGGVIHYGKETPTGAGAIRQHALSVEAVDEHYRAWAKKLVKSHIRKQQQENEHETTAAA